MTNKEIKQLAIEQVEKEIATKYKDTNINQEQKQALIDKAFSIIKRNDLQHQLYDAIGLMEVDKNKHIVYYSNKFDYNNKDINLATLNRPMILSENIETHSIETYNLDIETISIIDEMYRGVELFDAHIPLNISIGSFDGTNIPVSSGRNNNIILDKFGLVIDFFKENSIMYIETLNKLQYGDDIIYNLTYLVYDIELQNYINIKMVKLSPKMIEHLHNIISYIKSIVKNQRHKQLQKQKEQLEKELEQLAKDE